jgi:hypothetical protein
MIEFDVPGGTVRFREHKEVTARGRRHMMLLASEIEPNRFRMIIAAADDEAMLRELELTRPERELLLTFPDATILALLESWTLDLPLPRTLDEVGDLPAELYDALNAVATKMNADAQPKDKDGKAVDPWGVGAVEDLTSPTGASGGSSGRSAPAARRAPSDRRKPSRSRNIVSAADSA